MAPHCDAAAIWATPPLHTARKIVGFAIKVDAFNSWPHIAIRLQYGPPRLLGRKEFCVSIAEKPPKDASSPFSENRACDATFAALFECSCVFNDQISHDNLAFTPLEIRSPAIWHYFQVFDQIKYKAV